MLKRHTTFIVIIFLLFYLKSGAQSTFVKAWDQRFGGSKYEELFSMIQYDSASFLAAGKSSSDSSGNKSVDSKGYFDFWIARFDDSGNKISDFSFGGNYDDSPACMIVCKDSNILIGGYSDSDSSGDKSENTKGQFDFWIIKSDISGNKIWDKTYGGNTFCYLRTILKTKDGGFLLCGVTDSDSSNDVSQNGYGNFDYWILKTDSAGNKIFDKRFGGSDNDNLSNAVALSDGSFILSGISFSDSGSCKSQNNYDPTYNSGDYWIVKIDSAGNKIWDRTYGTSGNDKICNIMLAEKGNLLLCGVTDYYPASFDKSVTNHDPGWDLWVLKLDSSGHKLWDKVYGGQGFNEDEFTQAFVMRDSNYMFCASSYSNPGYEKSELNLGLEQSWILKVDTAGNRIFDKTIFTNGHDESCFVIELDGGCLMVANSNFVDSGGYVSQMHISDSMSTNLFGDFWVLKLCDTAYGFISPIPDFASSDTNWCDKLCIDFYDISQNNPVSWQWFFPGAQPDSSILQNPTGICYNTYGNYDVMLIVCNPAGCDTVLKQSFINEFQPPLPPIITQSNDTLFSSASFQYGWYEVSNPGNLLSTDSIYVITMPGQYYVIGIDTNGCMTPSNIITVTAIENLFDISLPYKLFYNAISNSLEINFENGIANVVLIEMNEASGKQVMKDIIPEGAIDYSMDCSNLRTGIYLVRLVQNGKISYYKFVISE